MPTTTPPIVHLPDAGLPLRTKSGVILSDAQMADLAKQNAEGNVLPSVRCCHTGGVPSQVADGNATNNGLGDTTVVATTTYIAEVLVPVGGLSTGAAIHNGSASANGNTQCALYDGAGNKIVETASTAGSGTDAFQRIPWTAPVSLRPGTYYLALQRDSTSDKVTTHTFGNFGASSITSGVYGTFPATINAPSTFTTAVGPVGGLY